MAAPGTPGERPGRRGIRTPGPLGRPIDPNAPGQVGRRPPNPFIPVVSGLMWIVVGIVMMIVFSAGWRFIAGAVCIGVGLLFARGGLAAAVRQSNRRDPQR